MLAAIIGSTMRLESRTISRTASVRVSVCATVNAVTTFSRSHMLATASTRPAGSYTVTVKGVSGTTLIHTVPIALTVT